MNTKPTKFQKETVVLKSGQSIIEQLFIIFILLGGLYKHSYYQDIHQWADFIYLGIALVCYVFYKFLSLFIKIKAFSKDNLNLLRAGLLFFFLAFLPVFIGEAWQALILKKVSYMYDPIPQNSLEWLGYAFGLPAIIAAVLFPFSRLISLAEDSTRKNKQSILLTLAAILVHLLTKSNFLLSGGFMASKLVPFAQKK